MTLCIRCSLIQAGYDRMLPLHHAKCINKENTMIDDKTPMHAQAALAQQRVMEASTGLNFMLDMQRQVESAWGRLPDPKDPEAVSRYVREVVLCTTDELHEVLAEVHWKPWKDKRGIKNLEAYREEMADVLHFILDLYLAAGLTGKDIVVDYMSKHYENMSRTSRTEYKES